MRQPVPVSVAVEGIIDEAVVARLVLHVGGLIGPVYGKNGKQYLRKHLRNYANAAKSSPWMVLVDLDATLNCAPELRRDWLSSIPASSLCFRVAVREVESWLMADQTRMAGFLGIRASQIDHNPDTLTHPKEKLVQLASRSRFRHIREDIVPRPESGRTVGPGYASRIIEFIQPSENGWRPDIAEKHSDSLRRCLASLKTLVAGKSGARQE